MKKKKGQEKQEEEKEENCALMPTPMPRVTGCMKRRRGRLPVCAFGPCLCYGAPTTRAHVQQRAAPPTDHANRPMRWFSATMLRQLRRCRSRHPIGPSFRLQSIAIGGCRRAEGAAVQLISPSGYGPSGSFVKSVILFYSS
jgi:hypothetical protein